MGVFDVGMVFSFESNQPTNIGLCFDCYLSYPWSFCIHIVGWICTVMPIWLILYIISVHLKVRLTDMMDVTITELRANLLKYLKIAQRGEKINVISKGTPLATLTAPITERNEAKEKLKRLAKTAVINDIVSPTNENWDAMK
jgi:prevent-host-death family protein